MQGRGGAKRPFAALLFGLLAVLILVTTLAPPARAALPKDGVGPINPDNGYPYWYQDANGTRLDLCLDNAEASKCLKPFEMPNPAGQMSFPDNFPGESFWWTGGAEATLDNGSSALLDLAMEAAFANENAVDGDQMSFGRVRIRIDGLDAGQDYRISHPYGVDTFTAEAAVPNPTDANLTDGEINSTVDIGCVPTPRTRCDFGQALSGKVGPFLTWDTFSSDSAASDPALTDANGNRYVGDPDIPHTVTGSVVMDETGQPQNYFKIEQVIPNDNGPDSLQQIGYTEDFTITGKVAELQVGAAPARESITNDPDQKIELIPSDPTANVYYTQTTDGTTTADPADPASNATLYDKQAKITPNSEAGVETTTTYRFVAVKGEQASEIGEKTYTVDRKAPNVTAESIDVDVDPADPNVVPSKGPGAFDNPQKVTLKASEEADIYYTTDGSDPNVEVVKDPGTGAVTSVNVVNGTKYEGPLTVERTQTIKALAVDAEVNPDTGERLVVGNKSQIKSFKYDIAAVPKMGPTNPQGGFPFWYQDRQGTKLDLCVDNSATSKCLVPFEMPNPDATMSFPENYPGEAFWWTGEADFAQNGVDALLVMAMEAAFANENAAEGDQMSFGRVRIRIDGLTIGQEYRVTHPYGVDTFTAEDNGKGAGEINSTVDIGCFPGPGGTPPCDFNDARYGNVGPFLKWTTFGQGADAAGQPIVSDLADAQGNADAYVGDPNVPHEVTGSPYDTNYFKLERRSGSDWAPMGETNQFAVSGQVSKFQAGISRKGGIFNGPQENIRLGASEEGSEIYYTQTTDGTEPADPTTGDALYTGPFTIATDTKLKFKAFGPVPADGSSRAESPVYTESYVIDTTAPTVVADPAGGTFNDVGPAVTLKVTNPEPGTTAIYYTTNGSDPAKATNRARVLFDPQSPINIRKDTTLGFMAVDEAGNPSDADPATPGAQSYTENYTVIDTTPPEAPTALDLSATSDTGASATDNITNATTLTFTGTAEAGSTVKILVGGVEKGSGTAGEDQSFSITTSALDPGKDIPVTATATDPSGNEGVASGALTLTIDTTNPSVSASPAGGTYPRAQSITLTPSETAKVYYTRNGGAPNPGAAGTTEATGPINVATTTTLRFMAVDTAGNRSGVSTQAYRIQNARPTITGMSPTGVVGGNAVIRARVLDSDSQLQRSNITLTVNGQERPFTYTAAGQLSYNRPGAYPAGRYNVRLAVTDQDGGVATKNWSFRVQ